MALESRHGLHRWEIAVAKKLVAEFRRRSRSLGRDEFDDLLQECLLHWLPLRQRMAFDPRAPPVAYMAQVLRNHLIDLAREREADKRRGEQDTVSLDDPVSAAEDAPTFADLVDAESGRDSGNHQPFTPTDVRLDVAAAMNQLTPEQKRLCELIGAQGLSIKEAAAKLRIPRATLYEEIKRIRKIFAQLGLDDYLRP